MLRHQVLVFVAIAYPAFAQTLPVASLAREIASEFDLLRGQPTLAQWRVTHPQERLKPATGAPDEHEFGDFITQDRKCATSVRTTPTGSRFANFYQPAVETGALPPLPDRPDTALIQTCRLQSIRFEPASQFRPADLLRELSLVWGTPAAIHDGPFRNVNPGASPKSWRRQGLDILVLLYPVNRSLFVYAQTTRKPNHVSSYPLDTTADAADIAALGPELTGPIISKIRSVKDHVKSDALVPAPGIAAVDGLRLAIPLARWLKAAKVLPAERQAAALLLADEYVWVTLSEANLEPYAHLGAGVSEGHLGLQNGRSFLEQAYRIVPSRSAAGELVRLEHLRSAADGESLLKEFPHNEWTPSVLWALAGQHEFNLQLDMFLDDNFCTQTRLNSAGRQREREATIRYYREFIRLKPQTEAAAYAWEETWRLLAGLRPSYLNGACGEDE